MNTNNTTEKFITSLFKINYEIGEIDDSVFLSMIRKTIEKYSDDTKIRSELKMLAQDLYVKTWLRNAEENSAVNLDEEKDEATEEFNSFYNET